MDHTYTYNGRNAEEIALLFEKVQFLEMDEKLIDISAPKKIHHEVRAWSVLVTCYFPDLSNGTLIFFSFKIGEKMKFSLPLNRLILNPN